MRAGTTRQRAERRARPSRSRRLTAALGAGVLALTLAACDLLPGAGDEEPSTSAAPAAPMDPGQVAGTAQTSVDPGWLCDPGGDHEAPDGLTDVGAAATGALLPQVFTADGATVTISGPLSLPAGTDYAGFVPEAIVVPADPARRGAPATGWEDVLAGRSDADSPAPPIVVRARVEVPADGAAPSTATAHLTLGTCDDAPLPDGMFLLRLVAADGTWAADGDVLLDVVGGEARAVPGAVTSPDGEAEVDLAPLACRAGLAPVGDGDGVALTVADPVTTVPAASGADGAARGVSATVTVTAAEAGTRVLLPGIVLVEPSTATIVAGARSADRLPLQWLGADGITRTETAWTTTETCTHGPLDVGDYEARAFAVTVDAAGATQVVLSDPWTVQVVEGDGS